ncbi:MAG: SDR family oxidoreductase [Acidobacteriia bacterium]|nr:SDR family oxidoreductase [Terriglobia bacterium]
MLDPQLKDRTVLVTGANNPHGIGAAIARAFAAQGASVFLHYFRPEGPGVSGEAAEGPGQAFYRSQQKKSAEEVLQSIRDSGVPAHAFEADLSDPAAIPVLFEEAERTVGPVGILVNNAAHWEGDTFVPAGAELANRLDELWTDRPRSITGCGFDRLFAVNVRAAVLLMAEFARRRIARGARWGRIVNISTGGAECFPSEVSYGAGKYALESYTRSAACELRKFGITVNAISLGPVQTGWITPELEREVLPSIPLGRIGAPDDVADVVVFLASHQARWVTGQKFFVGGGREM